jgi:hypothetical protein
MQSLLYDVGPRDPITITSVALILTSVALHACLGPALRGSRINPVILYGMNDLIDHSVQQTLATWRSNRIEGQRYKAPRIEANEMRRAHKPIPLIRLRRQVKIRAFL